MKTSEAIQIENAWGRFTLSAHTLNGATCLCLQSDHPLPDRPMVRLHSACVTSEVLGMTNCDCSEQFSAAMGQIGQEGGIVLYSEAEGRGAGIVAKLNALSMEAQSGIDSFAAYQAMGMVADCRDYALEAAILKSKAITSIRLLTNNPRKISAMEKHGIMVERCVLNIEETAANGPYLAAQRRAGYLER